MHALLRSHPQAPIPRRHPQAAPQRPARRPRAPGTARAAADAAARESGAAAPPAAATRVPRFTCRRCKQEFSEAENAPDACRFHPCIYTGGEVAKAVGFVRQSDAPEHQLEAVVGRKGLMRFWDCCGDEDEAAPGCRGGWHLTFDSGLDASKGWRD